MYSSPPSFLGPCCLQCSFSFSEPFAWETSKHESSGYPFPVLSPFLMMFETDCFVLDRIHSSHFVCHLRDFTPVAQMRV